MILNLPKRVADNIQNFTGRAWLLDAVIEWLEKTDDRFFILTGDMGAGKSMVAAWLAGDGPAPADLAASGRLGQIRAAAKAAHFCIADSGSNAPRTLADNLAKQLKEKIPTYNQALTEALKDYQLQILATINDVYIEAGATLTGIQIDTLNLAGLSDEVSYDTGIRVPLQKLADQGYGEKILLVIDGLDEALTYTGKLSIPRLISKAEDLPANVRFLVTSRDDPRVLQYFRGVKPFDLIENSPEKTADIRSFAYERLNVLPEGRRGDLAGRVASKSQGVFLYANLVLQKLLPDLTIETDIETIDLPDGLIDFYRQTLARELTTDTDLWFDLYQPLLGILAVAQGSGLGRELIEAVLGAEGATRALLVCKQYLDGDLPAGPFRLSHQSFVEFLTDKTKNVDFPIDAASMHRRILQGYQKVYRGRWEALDVYGVEYLILHLLAADSGRRLEKLDNYGRSHLIYHLQGAGRLGEVEKVLNLVLAGPA